MTSIRLCRFIFFTLLILQLSGCIKTAQNIDLKRTFRAQREEQVLKCPSNNGVIFTLEEIIEIALQNNLEIKIKEWECAIQKEAASGAMLEMLPELLANGEYSNRNNTPGASSESLDPGVPPAPPSVSSQRRTGRANLTLTWNLLDFGISYYRARQEANRIFIQHFEYEKLKQKIILEVTRNYWNAVVALASIDRTETFINELTEQSTLLENAVNHSYIANTNLLETQNQLYEHAAKVQRYKRELHVALGELSCLMGCAVQEEIQIAVDYSRPLSVMLPDVEVLERTALVNRPDLFSYDMQEAIDLDEVKVSILQYMPGISLFSGEYYDANKYLIKNSWFVIGTKAIWDLFSIPAGMSRTKQAKKRIGLTRENRLAMALAAITQVHIAHWIYYDSLEEYLLLRKLQNVRTDLLKSAELKREVGKFDLVDLHYFHSDQLDAEIFAWRAYGDLQYSLEQLNNAMGTPLRYKEGSPL